MKHVLVKISCLCQKLTQPYSQYRDPKPSWNLGNATVKGLCLVLARAQGEESVVPEAQLFP